MNKIISYNLDALPTNQEHKNMTPEQFDALAELLRLRDSAAVVASRAHFVDGLTIGDAARKAGITYNGAHQAVRRVKRGIELVIKAAGSNNETI